MQKRSTESGKNTITIEYPSITQARKRLLTASALIRASAEGITLSRPVLKIAAAAVEHTRAATVEHIKVATVEHTRAEDRETEGIRKARVLAACAPTTIKVVAGA